MVPFIIVLHVKMQTYSILYNFGFSIEKSHVWSVYHNVLPIDWRCFVMIRFVYVGVLCERLKPLLIRVLYLY